MFDQDGTAKLLEIKLLISAIARAANELRDGLINSPVRSVFPMGAGSGVLLSMPAVASDIGIHKLISVQPENSKGGFATIQGLVAVVDARSGRLRCILDGPELTGRRTAALSMLAIQRLLPQPPSRALLIGTGAQAIQHVIALQAIFPRCRVFVKGRTLDCSIRFCVKNSTTISELAPFEGQDFAEFEVITTLTSSSKPVFTSRVNAGQLLIAVGAYKASMAEIAPETVNACRIFVDDLIGAKHEAGDLIQATINWQTVLPLSAAKTEILHNNRCPTLFKSVGCAAWDLAACRVAVSQLN